MPALTVDLILAAGLADFRLFAGRLHARYRTGDFATGPSDVRETGADPCHNSATVGLSQHLLE